MALNCPSCKRTISDEEAFFCPYCSRRLKKTEFGRSDFPLIAGVLSMVTVSVAGFYGIAGLSYLYSYSFEIMSSPYTFAMLILSVNGILALTLGLTGGLSSLRKKHYRLAVAGAAFTVISCFLLIWGFPMVGGLAFYGGAWLFGFLNICISTLSLILIAVSKEEFHS